MENSNNTNDNNNDNSQVEDTSLDSLDLKSDLSEFVYKPIFGDTESNNISIGLSTEPVKSSERGYTEQQAEVEYDKYPQSVKDANNQSQMRLSNYTDITADSSKTVEQTKALTQANIKASEELLRKYIVDNTRKELEGKLQTAVDTVNQDTSLNGIVDATTYSKMLAKASEKAAVTPEKLKVDNYADNVSEEEKNRLVNKEVFSRASVQTDPFKNPPEVYQEAGFVGAFGKALSDMVVPAIIPQLSTQESLGNFFDNEHPFVSTFLWYTRAVNDIKSGEAFTPLAKRVAEKREQLLSLPPSEVKKYTESLLKGVDEGRLNPFQVSSFLSTMAETTTLENVGLNVGGYLDLPGSGGAISYFVKTIKESKLGSTVAELLFKKSKTSTAVDRTVDILNNPAKYTNETVQGADRAATPSHIKTDVTSPRVPTEAPNMVTEKISEQQAIIDSAKKVGVNLSHVSDEQLGQAVNESVTALSNRFDDKVSVVADVTVDTDPFSNTTSFTTWLGRPKTTNAQGVEKEAVTTFNNYTQARAFAKESGLVYLEGSFTAKQANAMEAGEQVQLGEILLRKNEDNSFSIGLKTDLDERTLYKSGRSPELDLGETFVASENWFTKWIPLPGMNAASRNLFGMSLTQSKKTKVAIDSAARYNKVLSDTMNNLAKPINDLSGFEKARLDKALIHSDSLDTVGRWMSQDELDTFYVMRFNELPTEAEKVAYYTAASIDKAQHALMNADARKTMVNNGTQYFNVRGQGKFYGYTTQTVPDTNKFVFVDVSTGEKFLEGQITKEYVENKLKEGYSLYFDVEGTGTKEKTLGRSHAYYLAKKGDVEHLPIPDTPIPYVGAGRRVYDGRYTIKQAILEESKYLDGQVIKCTKGVK